jgi:hypothetical protein
MRYVGAGDTYIRYSGRINYVIIITAYACIRGNTRIAVRHVICATSTHHHCCVPGKRSIAKGAYTRISAQKAEQNVIAARLTV